VLSTAIRQYIYVTVKRHGQVFNERIRLNYSKSEQVQQIEEIENNIARACLQFLMVEPPIYISTVGDLPASTGLGGSSSFAVGLLNALHAYQGERVSAGQLAEEASYIEIEVLKEPIGKQDQYMAAFGGITTLEIDRDGSVSVTRLCLGPDLLEALEANTLLFYTGGVRDATSILEKQDKDTKEKANGVVSSLSEIKDIGFEIRDSIVRGNMRRFGELLHIHWQVKKRLSNGITNSRINEWYELARRNGAIGGKISGAGGGGFLMLYCEGEKTQLREALRGAGLRELRFRFDFEGSKVVFDVVSRDGRLAHIRRQEKSSPLSSVVRAAYA